MSKLEQVISKVRTLQLAVIGLHTGGEPSEKMRGAIDDVFDELLEQLEELSEEDELDLEDES